jgi:hypothetical protein
MRRADGLGSALQLVLLLVRRIDQNEAAFFPRRDISIQRGPAIDRDRLDAGVAVQIA